MPDQKPGPVEDPFNPYKLMTSAAGGSISGGKTSIQCVQCLRATLAPATHCGNQCCRRPFDKYCIGHRDNDRQAYVILEDGTYCTEALWRQQGGNFRLKRRDPRRYQPPPSTPSAPMGSLEQYQRPTFPGQSITSASSGPTPATSKETSSWQALGQGRGYGGGYGGGSSGGGSR